MDSKDSSITLRGNIKERISSASSAKDIYALFSFLNYPKSSIFDVSYKRKVSELNLAKEEESKVKEIYTILSIEKKLTIFLIESKTIHPSFVRYLSKILAENYPKSLFIFTVDDSDLVFIFPENKAVRTLNID
jgi:hypothetical protein